MKILGNKCDKINIRINKRGDVMKDEKSFLDILAKEADKKQEEQKKVELPKSDKKPGSFEEEVFHRVDQPKGKNTKLWIGAGVAAVLAMVAIWFFFFSPKITMPDFEGKTLSDVSDWAKQYDINNSSVVVKREYNFDYAEDEVISQSQKPGSKIQKDTPLTFIISNGADPDEEISFPNLREMDQDEIEAWIEENKLEKTRVATQYHASIPSGEVIKYELKSVDESDFKRGSTLNIVISKGEAPLQDVTVVDHVGKTFEEFKTWANSKKIELVKVDGYSKDVEVGKIISQSVSAGTVIKEGSTIRVVVSQGEAIVMPNLVGYTKDMLDAWIAQNKSITVITKEEYNKEALGTVIGQSIASGTRVEETDVVVLTTSLYMPQLMTNSHEWDGKDYLELLAWVDDVNARGASISAGLWGGETCPDEGGIEGQITELECLDNQGNRLPYSENGCARPLPVDAKISITIVGKGCPVPTVTP